MIQRTGVWSCSFEYGVAMGDNQSVEDRADQHKRNITKSLCVPVCTVIFLLLAYCTWSICFYGDLFSSFLFFNGVRLRVVDREIDLGTIVAGEERNGKFRLYNISGKPVVVLGIQDCCGCIKTAELPMTIDPYQKASLTVIFSPNLVQTGVVEQIVLLNLNVKQPQEYLTIKAVVKPKL
jgi:hypothetical protein